MSIWKHGDTQPPMTIDCYDGAVQRADLSAATLVKVKVSKAGVLLWERAVATPYPTNGVVVVPLQSSDTATPGTYFVKVYAEWADGSHQHYPPGDRYMVMTVTR